MNQGSVSTQREEEEDKEEEEDPMEKLFFLPSANTVGCSDPVGDMRGTGSRST